MFELQKGKIDNKFVSRLTSLFVLGHNLEGASVLFGCFQPRRSRYFCRSLSSRISDLLFFLSIERARNAERVQWPNRNYNKYSSKFIIFCKETFISINISFRILKLYVIKILLNSKENDT